MRRTSPSIAATEPANGANSAIDAGDVPPGADMALFLQELFGQRLTAIMSGIEDPKIIGRWARGEEAPSPIDLRHLADAYAVSRLLLRVESRQGVFSWMVGMNPDLDDQAPAEVIVRDPEAVIDVAHVFAVTG
jgi:hypothetical protein